MPFQFLLLPGEIRNQILRLLLTHKTPIITRSANQLAPHKPNSLCIWPNILLTSRRIYNEGFSFLYSENTFQAHPSYLTSILFAIDPTRTVTAPLCMAMIRRFHIRVRLDCDPFYDIEDVAKAFNGADSLEVEVFRSSWAIGGYHALEGFTDVQGVKKAKVHGSVGSRFAKWLEKTMQTPVGVEAEACEGDDEFGWVGNSDLDDGSPWNHDR
ncbi:hypothetical protein ACLMJK_000733 [Lecanora helva]